MRTVEYKNNLKETEFYLGATNTIECKSGQSLVVNEGQFGVWGNKSNFGVGYRGGRYFCGSPECQVVFWVFNDTDLEALKELIGDYENICIVEE